MNPTIALHMKGGRDGLMFLSSFFLNYEMTREDILKFYNENRQNTDENSQLYKEILETAAKVYIARSLTTDPLCHDYDLGFNKIVTLHDSRIEYRYKYGLFETIIVFHTRGGSIDIPVENITNGYRFLKSSLEKMEKKIEEHMVAIGKIQEGIDIIKAKWKKDV